jgi:transposase InsO family protein
MLREWAYAATYRSSTHRRAVLPRWLYHYNHTRLHGSLGHKPPISVLAA